MDIGKFTETAKEKGFDTVAALSLQEAEAAIALWKTYVREGDFSKHMLTDPSEVLPGAASILLLAYPYRTYKDYPEEGVGLVSAYYVASNKAYNAAKELTGMLREQGTEAVFTHRLPQKPLANAAGLGRYGRNGVIVRKGSHIVLSTILTGEPVPLPPVQVPVPDCESCGKCETACPTGCLSGGYVQADRCLRTYMTHSIEDIPDDMRPLMGNRLIGCDECLNACPGLKHDPMPGSFNEIFAWDALTDAGRFEKNRSAIAQLIGTNNAGPIREHALYMRCDL